VTVHRIVPNLDVSDTRIGREFYRDLLGLREAFDLGWIVNFRSPRYPDAQLSLVSRDATAPEDSVLTAEVFDVERLYIEAQGRGYEIVHPLTEEPWGVRRFFLRDPHGHVINVVQHDR